MKVTHFVPYVFLSLASVSKGYIFYVFHIYIIIISSFMFVFSLTGCGLFLKVRLLNPKWDSSPCSYPFAVLNETNHTI